LDEEKCQVGAAKLEDYIKTELKEIWCEDVDWTGFIGPCCGMLWRSNECLNFREGMEFLISLAAINFSSRYLLSAISYFIWRRISLSFAH
jgi:hypothetical protein